jgi:hypothetical protein
VNGLEAIAKRSEAVTQTNDYRLPESRDLSRYRSHLVHLNLAPEREAELLATIWHMMGSFVDLAFGDDPVQHVHEMRVMDDGRSMVMLGSNKIQTQNQADRLSSAFVSPAAGRRKKERS